MDDPIMPVELSDVSEIEIADDATIEEVIDPSSVYPFPGNSCVQCQWYFCPPLDAIWRKEICMNICECV